LGVLFVGVLVTVPVGWSFPERTVPPSVVARPLPALAGASGGVQLLTQRPSVSVDPPSRWWNVTDGLVAFGVHSGYPPQPPPATGGAIGRDPGSGGAGIDVYFGGCGLTRCPSNETWIYLPGRGEPGHWENVTNPMDAPPAVQGASMAFDPRIPGFVLFGGLRSGGFPSNETWVFNDTARIWSNGTSSACRTTCPDPRFDASMVYAADPLDRATLLFGGCLDSSCVSRINDTFELIPDAPGFSWSLVLTPNAPSPRFDAAMAYDGDPLANETILFGGCGGFVADPCGLDDTWTFAGGSWTNATTGFLSANASAPGGRGHGGLSYDPLDNVTLLVGGGNASARFLDDNWQIVCSPRIQPCRWVNATDVAYGLPILDAAVAPESYGSSPLVVGGLSIYGHASNATWVFAPAPQISADDRFPPPYVNTSLHGYSGLGQAVQFFSSVVGGRPNNTDWSLWTFTFENQFTFRHVGNLTYTFEQVGRWWANVTVADVNDLSSLFQFTGVVIGPNITPVATPPATDVGLPVSIDGVTGGFDIAVPLLFHWDLGDGSSSSTRNVTHSYTSAGTYRVVVELTDNLSNNASGSVNITVRTAPSLAVALQSSTIPAGAFDDFVSTISNGTPPFTYLWSFGDGKTANGASPTHSYAAAGQYVANLTVYDAVGVAAYWQSTIIVGSPIPLAAVARANISEGMIGESIGFYATASGGYAPYSYAWQFGDGTGLANASVVHTFATNGSFLVRVWVNDSNGNSVTRTVTVRIGTTAGAGSSPLASSWVVFGAGAAILVALLAVLLLLRRRRQRPPPGPIVPPEPIYPERSEDDPAASSFNDAERS
jgi:PKD repeat protein